MRIHADPDPKNIVILGMLTYIVLLKDHHRGIRQGEGEGAGSAGPDED
jgi:hypothetical protein